MIVEKLERLKKVSVKIEFCSSDERFFDELENLRNEEYNFEGGKTAVYVKGNYRHNLEQTGLKQGNLFRIVKRKRPVKGAPSEYADYVRNFKQDVNQELLRTEVFIDFRNRELKY